ncbi:MAG: lipoyl(octanoyl) transferase LipB [Flavobacteriales bacterium]
MMRNVKFQDLGRIDYKKAWDYQTALFDEIVAIKIVNRNLPPEQQTITPNHLLFCEHNHVFTLGKSGDEAHLLFTENVLKQRGIDYYKINRGGDITYHGEGQITGYPIFDLDHFFTDIHKYLRYLEETIILTLKEYGIIGGRVEGLTGVWLDAENPQKARKICAMGVKCSRWVTMHGFAFNVNTDLNYFDMIVPCGIKDKTVTSLRQELGREMDMQEVKDKLKTNLSTIFDFDFTA